MSTQTTTTTTIEVSTSINDTNDTTTSKDPKKRDKYCWICHTYEETEPLIACVKCPRVYHSKCLHTTHNEEQIEGLQEPKELLNDWTCFECQKLIAEDTAQTTLKQVTQDQFYAMLNSAVKRLKYAASEPFQKEVDTVMFPHYHEFVIHPMDISQMEKKIELKQYVSLEAIAQDTKWIVHNCTIFNGSQNKLTSVAKSLFKMIKHELSEIDVCADCYLSSISKNNEQWFTEPCRTPHPLVYAKIKGFPYWPAKALKSIGTSELDVRFFGAHDRSLVAIEKCYWLSKELPANVRNHTMVNMQPSIQELNTHIKKLEAKFGQFNYAPPLMTIDINDPFVFIDAFKDINCLPTMSENNRITRKRTYMNSSNQLSTSATQSKPSTITNSISTNIVKSSTRQTLLPPTTNTTTSRRSGRTIIKKDSNSSNVDDSIILIDDELDKINTLTLIPTSQTNEEEEEAEETQQQEQTTNLTNTRSKRLRKISNKYSSYEIEPLTPINSNKRKSTRTTHQNDSISTIANSLSNTPTATTPTSSAKKLRSDSDSKSSTTSTSVILNVNKQISNKTSSMSSSTRSSSLSGHANNDSDNNMETETSNKLITNDDDNESTVSSTFSSSDLDRDKLKDLKRNEKRLRKDLAATATNDQNNDENNSLSNSTTATTSSTIVVKIPRYNLNNNEDSSSVLVSSTSTTSTAAVSPIKIKISRNQDDKSKTSSYSIDSSNSSQNENNNNSNSNKPATPSSLNMDSNSTNSNMKPNIKLNLGELFRSKKNSSQVGLSSENTSGSSSPLPLSSSTNVGDSNEPKFLNDLTNETSEKNEKETDEIKSDDIEMAVEEEEEEVEEEEESAKEVTDPIIAEKVIEEGGESAETTITSSTSSLTATQVETESELMKSEINEKINQDDKKKESSSLPTTILKIIEIKNEKTNDQEAIELESIEKTNEKQRENQLDENNSDSGLEPGEVVRAPVPQVLLNNSNQSHLQTQQQQHKKAILSNTLNTVSSQLLLQQQQQQQQQMTKFKKIAPAFPINMSNTLNTNINDTVPAILLATNASTTTGAASVVPTNMTASNFNILNTQNVNTQNIPQITTTTTVIKSKRELDIEKQLEEKSLRLKEMKQFYDKLLREMKQSHEHQQQQLIREIKYNCDLKISEIVKEASKKEIKLRAEFDRRLAETKSKQWCACCGKEAIYYCCWNTSYCDEECQKRHWSHHLKTCTRILNDQYSNSDINNESISSSSSSSHYTTNGTGYSNINDNYNNNNTNNIDGYNQFNSRPKQHQQQHNKPVHINQHNQHNQQSSHYQHFNTNNLQHHQTKKVPIPPNNHVGFNNTSNNNNNNPTSNNVNRKVAL